MEFFENLKEKLSAAADYTVRKTTEITEVTKLHLELKSQNGKLNTLFADLGKLTYCSEKNGTDNAEKIAKTVERIDAQKDKIAELQAQLAKSQGKVVCPACEAQCGSASAFCPVCGAKLPKTEAAAPATASEKAAETVAAPEETAE